MVLGALEFPVSEHNYRSAWAPNVNTALVSEISPCHSFPHKQFDVFI